MRLGRSFASCLLLSSVVAVGTISSPSRADDQLVTDPSGAYPQPSPFPIAWELRLVHSDPKRILVTLPGDSTPTAYWYITYSVINNANQEGVYNPDKDKERVFYPLFTMRTADGKLIRSDNGIHPTVFDAIKAEERNKYLEDPTLMGGRILLGQDQQRDSVAIWQEPLQRMGSFTIFASGMWGETASAKDSDGTALKDPKGEAVILHKTLMMNYHVDGDNTHFNPVRKVSEEFIMR